MQVSRFQIKIAAAVLGLGFFVFGAVLLSRPAIYPRWHNLKDGMTEAEVEQVLGTPTWTGNGDCTGAGGRIVTRWQYRSNVIGRYVYYCVDFDYIGPGGAPVVFRTERFYRDWTWPSWCPWRPPKCRG